VSHFIFTSESVSEGHPDKVCDTIADTILDAAMAVDPRARVAVEVLCKGSHVVLAGELSVGVPGATDPDGPLGPGARAALAREAIRQIGYVSDDDEFRADTAQVTDLVTAQAAEIARGVDGGAELGAGDQGIMFGYASDETPELMPLPILLAHRVTRGLAQARRGVGRWAGAPERWLRPDSKSQVSVRYERAEGAAGFQPVEVTDVVVSTQHAHDRGLDEVRSWVTGVLLPEVLGPWHHQAVRAHVNPAGTFVQGGPSADAGVTGRKVIVDTYGGMGRHGGGAFSGKDPSKVDRSGAYFARWAARQVVTAGLARRAEVQVSYAIGRARPVSVLVETFGTGDPEAARALVEGLDFRPGAILDQLDLLRPRYRETTNYGHFGRGGLSWEG
jgi:S-adenosylmethionine synthetase